MSLTGGPGTLYEGPVVRDVLPAIERWRREGKGVALATVVEVWGSAPREPGARMAISSAAEVEGSVSGGCVEAAVIEEAGQVLRFGRPRLVRYGVSDEQAWSVGLSCGGTIEVFLERLDPGGEIYAALRAALGAERLVTLVTVVGGADIGRQLVLRPDGTRVGSLGAAALDRQVADHVRERTARLGSERVRLRAEGADVELFVEAIAPRPKLVVVGAVHAAVALVSYARTLGFRTYVVDPRAAFATPERFAHADAILHDWPQPALAAIGLNETSYVVVLSHDLKLDLPALEAALASPARYVGALGSRRTHAKRIAALREAGLADDAIARIRAPVGLDLGARTPEEIALAIIAEIVAAARRDS